jgi:hypothetical protein
MPLLHYIGLTILALIFVLQLRLRSQLERYGKRIYQIALLLVLITLFYELRSDFMAIVTGDIGIRYYGPPYTPLSSFLFSAWSRILAPYVLSATLSLITLWAINSAKNYQDRFESGEPYIIALALLFLRHPYWLIYALIALGAYIAYSAIIARFRGINQRISFYYYWLPFAILVLALVPLLKKLAFAALLAFPNLR